MNNSLYILIFSIIISIVIYLGVIYAVRNARYPIGYLVIILFMCAYNAHIMKLKEEEIGCLKEDLESYSVLLVAQNNIKYLEKKVYEVTGTYYNPVASQCDEDFLLTASMDSIDTVLLNKHQLRWVALSRDLLEDINFDDTIIVKSDNNKINGEWIVKDVMNKRWRNRIDFLVPLKDTLNIGKTNLKIYKK